MKQLDADIYKTYERKKFVNPQEIIYKTHYMEREKQLLSESNNISQINKELILAFVSHKKFKGISDKRLLKYFNRLRNIALRLNKDFDKATKKDIEELVIILNDRPLSNWTKADDLDIIKLFYRWLKGKDKEYPEEVEDITIKRETKRRAPSELLDEEDILKMINSTHSIRNKTIIALLADSGLRVGELLNIKIKNLSYSNGEIQVMVETGKTGGIISLSGFYVCPINIP